MASFFSTRTPLPALFLAVILQACLSGRDIPQRTSPGPIRLARASMVAVRADAKGIEIDLQGACLRWIVKTYSTYQERAQVRAPCAEASFELEVETPWGTKSRASVDEADHSKIEVDWSALGIDALSDLAPQQLAAPWTMRAGQNVVRWQPKPSDIEVLLVGLGEATDTQVVRGDADAPPQLRLVSFRPHSGKLRAGATSQLELTIENQGKGAAYLVQVHTQSDHARLHGLRFPFGRIGPSEKKTRSAEITIPLSEHQDHVEAVLVFSEANGYAPESQSETLEMERTDRPLLVLDCSLDVTRSEGDEPPKSATDHATTVLCRLENQGAESSGPIDLTVRIDGKLVTSRPVDLLIAGAKTLLQLQVSVPTGAAAAGNLAFYIDAKESVRGATASFVLEVPSGAPARH